MTEYRVIIPVQIDVTVEAENEDEARRMAGEWVDWIEPTFEQFLDFQEDHPDNTCASEGTFCVNGKLEVELEEDPETVEETITNDRDWLDMRVGEKARVIGRFDCATSDSIVVSFSDWSSLSIDAMYAERLPHIPGDDIELVVERTEDGVFASGEEIDRTAAKFPLKGPGAE